MPDFLIFRKLVLLPSFRFLWPSFRLISPPLDRFGPKWRFLFFSGILTEVSAPGSWARASDFYVNLIIPTCFSPDLACFTCLSPDFSCVDLLFACLDLLWSNLAEFPVPGRWARSSSSYFYVNLIILTCFWADFRLLWPALPDFRQISPDLTRFSPTMANFSLF